MLTRQQIEQIAARWARQQGYGDAPRLREFDLGYVVWVPRPVPAGTVPGDGVVHVIDKETGRITGFPGSPAFLEERYRAYVAARRPAATVAADGHAGDVSHVDGTGHAGDAGHAGGIGHAGETGHVGAPGTAGPPTTAARLLHPYGQLTVHGVKGDAEVVHHPLVRAYLDALPAGQLVRGGERHAELVVVSAALRELGDASTTPDEARRVLTGTVLEVVRIREPGDPLGGPAGLPCESCVAALVHFGVLRDSHLAFVEPWLPQPPPGMGRGNLPADVAWALTAGGWRPGAGAPGSGAPATGARRAASPGAASPGPAAPGAGAPGDAARAVEQVLAAGTGGHRHEVFPAARRVLDAYVGVVSRRRGPGERVWIRPLTLDPAPVAHTADTLADFGRVIGSRLFPIGTESGDSILTVDEQGRIFALDQAGEWFLGPDIDTALTTLLLGRAAPRVHDDGTW